MSTSSNKKTRLCLLKQIDSIAIKFEDGWAAGKPSSIEEVLAEVSLENPRLLFEQLLAIELEFRNNDNESPQRENYLTRFPEWNEQIESAFVAIETRHLHDSTVAHDGSASGSGGLHIRCPHCHNPLELVPDAQLESISCPSCGSDFSLVGDQTATRSAKGVSELGHFKLVDRIGMGAFGAVWKARDTKLERTVAVKVPRKGQFDAKQERAFIREAQNSAQLNHPNIVPVYEVGRDGDTLYIVSEFIRGITLADWLTGQSPSVREAAELTIKVADALHHAHENGIIHRDLKPGNIMLDLEGEPHLMDFGLAKRDAGEITMSVDGQILGTPAYMSPEQAQGDASSVDRRSDVYSLGVLFFQLLTGGLPFRGNTRMLMHQVIHEEPPSPRKLNGLIPKDVETITLKCLEKPVARRYPTARQVSEELRRWSQGKAIEARPIGSIQRTGRWCKRNPLVATLSLAVVLSLATGFAMKVNEANETEKANLLLKHNQAELEKSAARLQVTIYNGALSLAEQLSRTNPGLAIPLLEDESLCPPQLRDTAWYFLHNQFEQSRRVVRGHIGEIESVAVSPDGKRLATAGRDRTIRMWDPNTGEALYTLEGHTDAITEVQFSKSGRTVTSCSHDKTLRIWDAISGAQLRQLSHVDRLRDFVYFENDRLVATCVDNHGVRLWNLDTEQPLGKLPEQNGALSLAYLESSKRLFVGDRDGNIYAYDLDSREVVSKLKHHRTWVTEIVVSNDGRYLASGDFYGNIAVWDLTDETVVNQYTLASRTYVWALKFNPSGKLLASTGADGRVMIHEPTYGKFGSRDITLEPMAKVEKLSVTREPDPLAPQYVYEPVPVVTNRQRSHSFNPFSRTSYEWSGHSDQVRGLEFSPDGKTLYSGSSDKTIRIWDTEAAIDDKQTHQIAGGIGLIEGPDGELAIFTDNQLRIWDTRTNSELASYPNELSRVEQVSHSPDGSKVALVTNQAVCIWDLKSDRLLFSQLGDALLASPVFSASGQQVAFSDNTSIYVVDLQADDIRSEEIASFTAQVYCLAFSRDGRFLIAGRRDHLINVIDFQSGSTSEVLTGHTAPVNCVAVSNASDYFATGSSDKTVRMWNASTGELLHTMRGHTSEIKSLGFSPIDDTLVSLGRDNELVFADASSGQLRMNFRVDPRSLSRDMGKVTWLSEGRQLAAVSKSQTYIWDVKHPQIPSRLTSSATVSHFAELGKQWLGSIRALSAGISSKRIQQEVIPLLVEEVQLQSQRYGPDGSNALLAQSKLATAYAMAGQFDEANAVQKKLGEQILNLERAASAEELYWAAVVSLQSREFEQKQSLCLELLRRHDETGDAQFAERAAYAAVSSSVPTEMSEQLINAANLVTDRFAGNERILGACLYRAGRYKVALAAFEESHAKFNPVAWDYCFLAMLHHQLGNVERAVQALNSATKSRQNARNGWYGYVESDALLSEANSLIQEQVHD